MTDDGAPARRGRDAIEARVFAAAEQLLAQAPARDLTVEDLLRAARVARRTFYKYFDNKEAVIAALAHRTLRAMYPDVGPFFSGDTPHDDSRMRASLLRATSLWAEHRGVLRLFFEHWQDVPQIRDGWLEMLEHFTALMAAEIDGERSAGRAPAGPDSRALAATLIWATAHNVYIAGLQIDDDLLGEGATVEPLLRLWHGAIYGAASTDRRNA